MTTAALKSRLHNEIVYPLLGALMAVGVVAVVLGVTVIGSITETWVDEQARYGISEAAAFVTLSAQDLQKRAGLAARDPVLDRAMASGDVGKISARLAVLHSVLGGDAMFVVDDQGIVVAAVGEPVAAPRERLLPEDAARWLRTRMAYASFIQIRGDTFVMCMQPVPSEQRQTRALVLCARISDSMLAVLQPVPDGAIAIADANGTVLGVKVDPAIEEAKTLDEALRSATRSKVLRFDTWTLGFTWGSYRVRAERLSLPDDPRQSSVVVIAAAPTTVVEHVRASTTFLIVLWTVVAVGSLFALGWYLAVRVGRPLAELSDAVERVAAGDFSVEFEARGHNEIAALSENLGRMTISLRERTEGLMRKVLELATLYEMSRVLGSTLDLDALLDAVLDSTLRIFGADSGYVALLDKDTQNLVLRAWRTGPQSRAPVMTGGSMAEWVAREGRPLLFNPASGNGQRHVDPATGSAAALCVPLHGPDGVIGVLAVGSSDAEARYTSEDVRLLSTIANHATIAIGNIDLYTSLQDAYLSTVRALAAAIDAKDPYTRGHSERVATYALMIAERLDLSSEQRDALEMASYLHDIGKIGISEDILLKPGKLSDEEMGSMRHHPLIGASILRPVSFPWPILPVVRHHHEWFDGGGYPAGLRGEEIPLLARILTVADAYEAMTSDRPYRRGRSIREAIAELRLCSGSQFDPRIVEAFTGVLDSLMEQSERTLPARAADPQALLPELTDAALSAVCEGVMAAFRRLGGPRLAANVEREVGARLRAQELPFTFRSGHLVADIAEGQEPAATDLEEVLCTIIAALRDAAGPALTGQFVTEAVQQLPERMRAVVESVAFEAMSEPRI